MRHTRVDLADYLSLCAVYSQADGRAGTVPNLGAEEGSVGIVDGAAVDADDEVEPGLQRDFSVGVAQDLETERASGGRLLGSLAVVRVET